MSRFLGLTSQHRAWVLAGVGGASMIAALATPVTVPQSSSPSIWIWQLGAMVPAYAVGVGALLMRPRHATAGWLVAVGSWLAIATAATRTVPVVVADAGPSLQLASNVLQVGAMMATATSLAALLVAFPDAEPSPRRQRFIRVLWALPFVVSIVWVVAFPTVLVGAVAWPQGTVPNPWFVPAFGSLATTAAWIVDHRSVVWLVGGVALLLRWRHATPTVRTQLTWPMMAASLFALALGALLFLKHLGVVDARLHTLPQYNGWVPGIALVTSSMLVALIRHRLVEVDLWLRRTVLVGGMSAMIALAYLALAGLIGLAAGHRASMGVGVLMTLVAVALFEPLRRRVEAYGRRRVRGSALSGEELLRRVGGALQDTQDTTHIASTVVATVVDGLDLEWARLSRHADDDGPSLPIAAANSSSATST